MKTFVTSFNKKLYDSYGKNFINSWKANASDDIKLIICFEGELFSELMNFEDVNLKIINIASSKQENFLNKFAKLNEARGIRLFKNSENLKVLNYNYNYRFDAIRFSFKIFSLTKAIDLNLINSNFAWIDSDIICLNKFNSAILNGVFPADNELASYLGRSKFPLPNPYSECGFVGYNYHHPQCFEFIESMYNLYENGDIFSLPEWHDCMAFDFVRNKYQNLACNFKNLSANFHQSEHPFMDSELGAFFDHLKGPERKKIGHS